MKNWKTILAFFIGIITYPYSLYQKYDVNIISITATVFVILIILFMARDDKAGKLIDAIIDYIRNKK